MLQTLSQALLLQYIREKYWEYEYEEVVTPNIYNFELWKTSGHADHYKQNMFHFDIEKQEFGLKPMNCPGEPSLGATTSSAVTTHQEVEGVIAHHTLLSKDKEPL